VTKPLDTPFFYASEHVHQAGGHIHAHETPPAPTAAKSVEAGGWEGLSSEQRENVKQLFDQYGTEEGLRRFREMDPDAARRFERRHPPVSPRRQGEDSGRDVPSGHTHPDGQSHNDAP